MKREPGLVGKVLGWVMLAAILCMFGWFNYSAFTAPHRWRGSGGDVRVAVVVLDILFFGAFVLLYRFARKHERAMKDAGYDPREIGEAYWEAYALRSRAEAAQRGGDIGERMTLDLVKRMVGLDGPRVLAPAEIRAAVRQAAVTGKAPPHEMLGTWTSAQEAGARPGWTAQVELREEAGNTVARLWAWGPSGVRDEGESAAHMHEGFVEVKREAAREVRVLRLTPGNGPDSVTLDEYRFPPGRPRQMQVNSCAMRRVRA